MASQHRIINIEPLNNIPPEKIDILKGELETLINKIDRSYFSDKSFLLFKSNVNSKGETVIITNISDEYIFQVTLDDKI